VKDIAKYTIQLFN